MKQVENATDSGGMMTMMVLLTLIFLAAVAGIVKPYFKTLTRKQFTGIAAAAFVGMIIFVPTSDTKAPVTASTTETTVKPESVTSTKETAAEPVTKWTYSETPDAMRGTTSRYASITSENEVDLDFPYGEQRGEISIRRNPESGLNIMFSVGKGQILCNGFTNTTISVKFDDGPIKRMRCTGTDDGSSDTAFFTNEGQMLVGLKQAKRTIIEADFYQKGSQQFVFETAGLNWQ